MLKIWFLGELIDFNKFFVFFLFENFQNKLKLYLNTFWVTFKFLTFFFTF